jgi:arabinogalactan endo-1,4-beta-galactosidase
MQSASRINGNLGFRHLSNYHYSDAWADPRKQTLPAAWEGKSHDELVQAVFDSWT